MNRIELMPSDDEQEAYASSGEDWTPQSEEVKVNFLSYLFL